MLLSISKIHVQSSYLQWEKLEYKYTFSIVISSSILTFHFRLTDTVNAMGMVMNKEEFGSG
jgi:hypothetical protein